MGEKFKKEKHKKKKKMHGTEGTFTKNRKENDHINKKKKKKGSMIDEMLNDNHKKKMKRPIYSDPSTEVSEISASKASKKRKVTIEEEHCDNEVLPYIEQLLIDEDCSQAHNSQSNEVINDFDQDEESDSLGARKVRGPTLLKEIWNMPRGKTIDVQFNNRNQAVGKEGRKLASFLGIVARTPSIMPLNIDDWRSYDKEEKNKLLSLIRKKFSIPMRGEEFVKKSLGKKWRDYKCDLKGTHMAKYKTKDALLKSRPKRIPRDQWTSLVSYWLSDKAKKRSQANRVNRTMQKMPHTGGSRSIATLMNELAKDGIKPSRAEIFLLTHKARKDGRPLDEEFSKTVELIQEKLNSGQPSNDQSENSVAYEGDVYSQVLGTERSGYIRGLGLGPTPSLLWGNKSSLGNLNGLPNDSAKKLEQEIKELKEKHEEEMNLMKENQDKMLAELSFLRHALCKFVSVDSCMPKNSNGSPFVQIPDANSSHDPELATLKKSTKVKKSKS